MSVSLLAHWTGRSIYDLDPAALARKGIRLLLADLDNTLVPYGVPEPDQPLRDWSAALAEAGVTLYVLSNNRHPQRPGRFSEALGVPYTGHAGKPKAASFFAARAACLARLSAMSWGSSAVWKSFPDSCPNISPRACLQGNCRLGQEQRQTGAFGSEKSAETR